MHTAHLIVPRTDIMKCIAAIDEGDIETAKAHLEAIVGLCSLTNQPLTETAPSLFRACELAVKYLAKAEADGMECVVPVSKARRIVEAAIAKAKGEKSGTVRVD